LTVWRYGQILLGEKDGTGDDYDKMKAICLDTMVRHCLETEDEFAECLIQELVLCGIVHRMGSLFGNESIPMLTYLANEEFIHPRLLEAEE
jgi:hypothetical protein